jgi:probable rRNA maturation factor
MASLLRCSRSFLSGTRLSCVRRTTGICQRFSTVPSATVEIYNDQATLPNIDEEGLRKTVSKIRSIIGYEKYSVTLLLVDDDEMRETNLETRKVDSPTDILSFPMHDAIKPGVLEKPQFDIPEMYNLGDMMVDVPYVIRQCKEDEAWEYEDDDVRGVSAAMSDVFDAEQRIHMLLVHGMLHLVGYDHIEDDDYDLMATREDEIMKELGLLRGEKP